MSQKLVLLFLSLWLLTSSCTGPNSDSAVDNFPFNKPANYFSTTQNFVADVYYEAGAEPYVGAANVNRNQLWFVLEDNLTSIFQYRTTPPTLTVPKTLAEMTLIADQAKASWTISEMLSFNTQYRNADSTATSSRVYVYFVNGYYNDGTSNKTNVLGVSIGGTPVIFMFKDVVAASSGSNTVRRFVEQSTLVHEMGHALGFVNNGVPLTTSYQDTAHGKHSTNTNCVMYYLNEGASDLIGFIVQFQASSNFVMWGAEILADAQSFSR